MNSLFLLHFTTIGIGFILGILVFLANPSRRANRFFFMLAVTLTAWMSCQAVGFSLAGNAIVTCIRTCMFIAVFIPLIVDWLQMTIMHPDRRWQQILLSSPYWLLASIAFAATSMTNLFVAGATRIEEQFLPEPVYTAYFPIYAVYFILSLGIMLLHFAQNLKKASGAPKTELQFIMLGNVTGFTVGVIINIILPLMTGNSKYALLTPLSVICLYAATGYGIATRRIMDVATLMRRFTAYAFLILFLGVLYVAVWLTLEKLLSHLGRPFTLIPHFIASLVVAFSLTPSRGWMKQLTNHLIFNFTEYDTNRIVQSTDSLFRSIYSLDRLLGNFATLVTGTIGADSAVIVLRQQNQYIQRYPESSDHQLIIPLTDPLAKTLSILEEPVVSDVLRRLRLTPDVEAACLTVEQLNFAAAIGLFSHEGMEGLLLLPPRLSGRIYGAPEQRILQLLCNQLASAISSIRLYTQLQDSQIYNEILVDSLFSGVIAAGPDGTITVFNREARRITHRATSDTLAHPLSILPAPLNTLLQDTLENGTETTNTDHLLPQEQAEPTPIQVSSSVIFGHAGKRLGAFLVINDLTTIKQLENQIRRTDRLASLGTLAAGMAHEIKNPLVSIKTFTQLLPERYADPDFRDTFSSLIGGEVKRIDSIVNQLLRFSRPSKPVLAPSSLHDLLNRTIKLLKEQMRTKSIQLSTSYAVTADRINADGDQLCQAFVNFFLNAIDSMQENGVLTVTTTLPPSVNHLNAWWTQAHSQPVVLLSIRDTGEGISEENLAHIFDPFFTTKTHGTGLGLSVAHGIIQEHGGVIDVRSEPGVGTTFTIAIPLLEKEPPS